MDELELLILSNIKGQSQEANPPKFTMPRPTNFKKEEIEIALRTIPKASPTMGVEQQHPVAARADADGVDIFKFENVLKIDIKKEKQDMKNTAAHQKRVKEKYPKLDGTPVYLLEEIERLQNEYAEDGCDNYIEVSDECRGKLCLSKYGPWLNLTRLNFPRRKKGVKHSVKEYIVIPLLKDGPFGSWKLYDNDAKPELTSQSPWKDKPIEKPIEVEEKKPMRYQRLDGEVIVVDNVIDHLEEFAAALNAPSPPSTPPPEAKHEEYISDSELSSAKTMDSIEFDESFSSNSNTIVVDTSNRTQSMAAQHNTSPTITTQASSESSTYNQSVSPSPSPGSTKSHKTLSRTRMTCIHCGTTATLAWRNGPPQTRNRCMNPRCNKPRDY